MKIAEQNHSRLVLAEKPRFLAGTLFLMAGVLGWMLWNQWSNMDLAARGVMLFMLTTMGVVIHFSVHWVEVRFSRALGTIEISRRGVVRNDQRRYRLDHFDRARLDESSSNDGTTYRVVLVFDEAMVAEMPADLRDNIQKQTRRGFRQTPPHEVPLTYYFSGGENAEQKIVDAINDWAGG